jgi:hypothetical protein
MINPGDRIKSMTKGGRMFIVLLVLMSFCLLPAAGMVNKGTAEVSGISQKDSSSCSWTGNWSTRFGNMSLQQIGDMVKGTYDQDSGRIEGTISGTRLIGNWSEAPTFSPPGEAGQIVFMLSEDCMNFSGQWRYGSEGNWSSDWSGERAQSTDA